MYICTYILYNVYIPGACLYVRVYCIMYTYTVYSIYVHIYICVPSIRAIRLYHNGMYKCTCIYVHYTMYVHVCTYVYTYVCTCVYVYTYVCVCVYVHTYVCVCLYVYTYVCVCVYVCMCMCICVYVCMCICICGAT